MKSKKLSLSVSIALIFTLCLSWGLVSVFMPAAGAYAADYYSEITAKSGTALLGQLHDLIVKTHTYYSSYNDCKNPETIKKTDGGKASGTVMEFYTQADMSSKWGGGDSGTWNREHVWAQSLSNGLWGTNGAGSDLHHIRPSEANLNGKRGNKLYGNSNGGTPQYATGISGIVGGYISGNTFEPIDSVKGDVARIIMYVYTHYNNASNVGGTTESKMTHGNLPVTNIVAASNADSAWALMLKWNKLDPVDEIERTRNEEVYKIQHNRNPFIDNESYADAIWGGGTIEEVELEGITLTPNTLTLTAGEVQTLNVNAIPSNAKANVTWNSSDTSVATVSNGRVTAVAEGSATITAVSTDNSAIKASATVTVKKAPVITAIELIGTPTYTQYEAGQTFNPAGLTVKATYDDGTTTNINPLSDARFEWLDADSGQRLLTTATTKIKCKIGNIECVGNFTVTVAAAPENIGKFVDAVAKVSAENTLQARLDAIKSALDLYDETQKHASEKDDARVKTAYQTLLQLIDDYNKDIQPFNDGLQKATGIGGSAVCTAMLAATALAYVLQRKFK